MKELWRKLTGTRTMRSAAAEFGPPPGARYAADLAHLSNGELLLYGEQVVARVQSRQETARDRTVVDIAVLCQDRAA